MGRLSRLAGAAAIGVTSLFGGEADAQFLCQIRTPAGWVQQGYIPHGYAGPMVLMRNGYPLAGSYFRGYFRTGRLSLNFGVDEARPFYPPVSSYEQPPVLQYYAVPQPVVEHPVRYRHAPGGVTEQEGEDVLYHELDRSGVPFRWKKYADSCGGFTQVDAQSGGRILDVVPTSREAGRRAAILGHGYTSLVVDDFDSPEELRGAVRHEVRKLRNP